MLLHKNNSHTWDKSRKSRYYYTPLMTNKKFIAVMLTLHWTNKHLSFIPTIGTDQIVPTQLMIIFPYYPFFRLNDAPDVFIDVSVAPCILSSIFYTIVVVVCFLSFRVVRRYLFINMIYQNIFVFTPAFFVPFFHRYFHGHDDISFYR